MCLFPRLIDNPKYKSTKKNGGIIPPIFDERVKSVPIGCGKCIECTKQKANNWRIRLLEEIKTEKGIFVTLSFTDEQWLRIQKMTDKKGYDLDNHIATQGMRWFLENYRKKHKKSIRHWAITELGQKNSERIHIHAILFNVTEKDVTENWLYGNTFTGTYVNEKTVNYIVKYLSKIDKLHKGYRPTILCSAGIGSKYTDTTAFKRHKYNGKETDEKYRTRQGKQLGIPIYYRNKAFTEEEREKLWIHKMDEKVRYVLGQKIDISVTEKEYRILLRQAQITNYELGFDKPLTWEEDQYERR